MEKVPGVVPLLRRMYGCVLVPPTVLGELAVDLFATGEAYLAAHNLTGWVQAAVPAPTLPVTSRLDLGERGAISLAHEHADFLC